VRESHSCIAVDGELPETTEWIKQAAARRSPSNAHTSQGRRFQKLSQSLSQCSGCHCGFWGLLGAHRLAFMPAHNTQMLGVTTKFEVCEVEQQI
jgi:hypothetical protein